MPEKISILKESGEEIQSNIISIFMVPETGKKYIITTENAVDPHGLTVLHVSEIVGENQIAKVSTDEEWSNIKTIMRSIISGNAGSYQYQPLMTKANVSGQYSRDISVSMSATQQMTDSYAKGRENLKTETPPAPSEVAAPENGNSIFPTNGNQPSETNEVIPGIAEVPAGQPQTEPVEQTPAPAPAVEEPAPVAAPQVAPTMPSIPSMPTMGAANNMPAAQPAVPVQPEAPVQQPTEMNMNAAPSFKPDASLDEVVTGSTELFMAGVKNLTDTITEKVYRDLYKKEEELKQREAMLNQREQMLNQQMMNQMNYNPMMYNPMGMNNMMNQGTQSIPTQQMPMNQNMGAQQTQAPTQTVNPMMQNPGMNNMNQMSGAMNPMGMNPMMPQMPQVPQMVTAANDAPTGNPTNPIM